MSGFERGSGRGAGERGVWDHLRGGGAYNLMYRGAVLIGGLIN